MPEEKLTGSDYVRLPITELVDHPDYDPHVFKTMLAICAMNNNQISQLDISKLIHPPDWIERLRKEMEGVDV